MSREAKPTPPSNHWVGTTARKDFAAQRESLPRMTPSHLRAITDAALLVKQQDWHPAVGCDAEMEDIVALVRSLVWSGPEKKQ